jgi:hypothetical protein
MVGTGGFEPHGSMMPVHDAEADRRMRQRDARHLGRQTIVVLALTAAMFVVLAVATIATGTF